MASPLQTGKQSVNLARAGPPGSRIRRDPKPVEKELEVRDRNEHDTRMVVIGVIAFALAIVIITLGFASAAGWTARDYIIHV